MLYNWALKQTLERFDIQIAALARQAQVDRTSLTQFVNGHKGMTTPKLEVVLDALPLEARTYFYKLVQERKTTEVTYAGVTA